MLIRQFPNPHLSRGQAENQNGVSKVLFELAVGGGQPPETSLNTSPPFVYAVIKELRKAKPTEIILTEASPTTLERSGLKKAAEEAGVDKILGIMGEKDLTTNQLNYDFDTAGLTFGMDLSKYKLDEE